MTYIVGIRYNKGIIFGADGLVTRYNAKNPEKVESVFTNKRKVYQLTPYLMIGFSGNAIYRLDTLAKYLRESIKKFKPKSVNEMMRYIRADIASFYLDVIDSGVHLEMLVAGYDLNRQNQPTIPRLYYWNPITRVNRQYACRAIGRTDTELDKQLAADLSDDVEALTQKIIDLIATSASKYPEDVGGSTFIYHLTKTGIETQKVASSITEVDEASSRVI